MTKRDFPRIHFYDQDFVDIYDKSWNMLLDNWLDSETLEKSTDGYLLFPQDGGVIIKQIEAIESSFFLVYSNRNLNAFTSLDYFYSKQEKSGAIRSMYDMKTGTALNQETNPEGVGMPLFSWAEFNIYHKSGNKKRIREVLPILDSYTKWLDKTFKQDNGLYSVPLAAMNMQNSPRCNVMYPIDFNCAMAINAAHMSALGDILNDKETSFQYKKIYFSLKTRINSLMWDSTTGFYHDLDANACRLPLKTIAGFWPLVAELPNADKADILIAHLQNPTTFGSEHPFPSLSLDSFEFKESGEGYCGSVYPALNFMVIKGLEKYNKHDLARECAIRHLYFVLEALFPNGGRDKGYLYEAYLPCGEGPAKMAENDSFPRKNYLYSVGLSTIALMIENVIGLSISLPRKTVDWVIPNLEIMGIENLSLKRNLITILSNKTSRGWEVQMESEKLYYFTINVLGQKKKTLPIPSGKCSMLIDKL